MIIIEPAFDCYKSLVHLAGGTTKSMPLRHSNPTDNSCYSWTLDYAELRSLFNDKTKAIILNTPNNPLGKVFTNEELMVKSYINKISQRNLLLINHMSPFTLLLLGNWRSV